MTAWGQRLDNPVSERLRDPASTGYVAIALGAFAAFLAIPPIEARSPTWPIAIGIVAIALGIWTATRGRRRLGYGAAVAGLLGIGLGILATKSGTGNLETVFDTTLVAQTFGFATPLVFGAIAGMFSERSGVVNIGLEGMMLMGAFWGVYGADKGGNWVVGLLVGMVSGGLLALVYAYFAIHLRADQIVGGTAVNFLAYGITGYFFQQIFNGQVTGQVSTVPNLHIPGLGHFLEGSIGDLSWLTWASFALVIVAYIVLFKTPIGLRIRACGEHPRAANTVGINVYAIRYACVVLSGLLVAIGGVYLSLGPQGNGTFINNMTNGRGFIALAAMIFGNWRPAGAFAAALLFGFSSALALKLQVYSNQASTLFAILPYVLTLIAVAGVIGRTVAPAADGKPYAKQ
ncbi:MAG TPA: ABC transporter permease [Gaiellaceae bacterium]